MINAMNNNFTSAIPSFFGLLPNLQSLYLSFNQFSGNIPPSLFNISKLKYLGLRGNFLDGEIPQEISSLCCLNTIDQQDNKLTGSISPTQGVYRQIQVQTQRNHSRRNRKLNKCVINITICQ